MRGGRRAHRIVLSVYVCYFAAFVAALVLLGIAPAAAQTARLPASERPTAPPASPLILQSGRWPILQGATNANSTEVIVLLERGERIRAEIREPRNAFAVHAPVWRRTLSFQDSPWVIEKLRFTGLRPGVQYLLRVRGEGPSDGVIRASLDGGSGGASGPGGEVLDEREIGTLDMRLRSVRIVIASCMNDLKMADGGPIWNHVVYARPDLMFFVGDNVYADKGDSKSLPAGIWRRYAETRLRLPVFRAPRLIPVLATWDDHDYGVNDGDRSFRHKLESRRIFEAFFGQQARIDIPELKRGPGVASHFRGFGQEFVFLDGRSFRNRDGYEEDRLQWGAEQETWMSGILASARGPVWLINGTQFFGGYHGRESVEGLHPGSLNRLLDRMRASPVPAVLVSGDVHFSELMSLEPALAGYETLEITSSSMHGRHMPYSTVFLRNPRRLSSAWRHNFVVADARVDEARSLRLELRSIGRDGYEYFRVSREIRR